MVDVKFGSYSPPDPKKDDKPYIYYTIDGEYLGGMPGSLKIYLTTKDGYDGAVKAKDYSIINQDTNLVKYKEKAISHSDFRYIAYIVNHESGSEEIKELRCIAFTSYNRSESTKKTWRSLLASGYSSVPNKKELPDNNQEKSKLTRKAILEVLSKGNDITNGAEFWDGTDFLAWGNSETNPYNKLGQNKFDEYKFIEIPKAIYDEFLAAQGSTTVNYKDSGKLNPKTEVGTHQHITKKVKKPLLDENKKPVLDKNGKPMFQMVDVPNKIRYKIPAAEFENQQYWISGDFYYETGVKVTNGISATITAGKSIFWKITPSRLTPPPPTIEKK